MQSHSSEVLLDHTKVCVSLTTAEYTKSGAVVLCHPIIPILDEKTDGSGCRVEVCYLEPLDHLPVTPYTEEDTHTHKTIA